MSLGRSSQGQPLKLGLCLFNSSILRQHRHLHDRFVDFALDPAYYHAILCTPSLNTRKRVSLQECSASLLTAARSSGVPYRCANSPRINNGIDIRVAVSGWTDGPLMSKVLSKLPTLSPFCLPCLPLSPCLPVLSPLSSVMPRCLPLSPLSSPCLPRCFPVVVPVLSLYR